MALVPYDPRMKMTMHINEDTLTEVMKITGVPSKTKAVEVALTEMVRRHKFREVTKKGLGLTPEELRNAWEDPFKRKPVRAVKIPRERNGRKHSGR